MKLHFFEEKLGKVAIILEIIITLLIGIGVIIGLIDLVKYLIEIYHADMANSYEIFHHFLEYALVLVVGVEFMLMLLTHSTKVMLELILFVVARKMLIYAHSTLDLVFGALAVALIFVSLRFLLEKEDKVKMDHEALSASAKIDE